MPNPTPNKTKTSQNTNEFHRIRIREYQRSHELDDLGAVADDGVAVSYFAPSLREICANLLAQNLSNMQEIDFLREEDPSMYNEIIKSLPITRPSWLDSQPSSTSTSSAAKEGTTVGDSQTPEEEVFFPLSATIPRISDENYWKRCCEARWSVGQLSKFISMKSPRVTIQKILAGEVEFTWKRLFLENLLNDFLLALRQKNPENPLTTTIVAPGTDKARPGTPSQDRVLTDMERRYLSEFCALARNYIHEIYLPHMFLHIDFNEYLFSKLPQIESLTLTFGASNAGIAFEKSMTGMNESDVLTIKNILKNYMPLKILRLANNKLNDIHVQVLCSGLVANVTLRILDLSCNSFGDSGVEALATILGRPDVGIEEVYLGDNNITSYGAHILSQALRINHSLKILHLNQNRITDGGDDETTNEEGMISLLRSLPYSSCLEELDISCNALGQRTPEVLAEVLPNVATLKVLNLSGNIHLCGEIVKGNNSSNAWASSCGAWIRTAMEQNNSLLKLDVRSCNLGQDDVQYINNFYRNRVRNLNEYEKREEVQQWEALIAQRAQESVMKKKQLIAL